MCIFICMCIHMYVCMYVYIYVYIITQQKGVGQKGVFANPLRKHPYFISVELCPACGNDYAMSVGLQASYTHDNAHTMVF